MAGLSRLKVEDIFKLAEQECFWEATDGLLHLLQEKRTSLTNDEWDIYVRDELMNHPIKELMHLDPYTKRAFDKPRGYAGDAVMIDYLYGIYDFANTDQKPNYTGEEIFRHTTNSVPARAVRYRRKYIAEAIDEICSRKNKEANILSIAAGHFREAELSKEIQDKNFHSVIALDQDKKSLEVVENEYSKYGVETKPASIRSLITGKTQFNDLDLVYAAGLFDYVEKKLAQRLVKVMYDMLRQGGKVIISNFTLDNPCRGYMESYMDWKLIYRDKAELIELFEDAVTDLGEIQISFDPTKSIVFGVVTK